MKSNNRYSIIISLCMICQLCTLVYGWIPILSRYWLTLGLSSCIALIINKNFVNQKHFVFLLLYTLLVIINVVLGDDYFFFPSAAVVEFSMLFFPAAIFHYIVSSEDQKLSLVVCLTMLAIVMLTSVLTYRLSLENNDFLRQAFLARENAELVRSYYRAGLSNYSLPHAIPVIIPAVVMAIRSKSFNKTMKIFMCLTLFALFILVYLSGATTPLILSFFSVIISFIVSETTVRSNIIKIAIIGLLCIILVNDTIMMSILDFLDSLVGHEGAFHSKIIIFEDLIGYNEVSGDLSTRIDRYTESQDAIVSHFFFGTNGYTGGHTALFARFASLGVFGFIFYVVYIYNQVRFSSTIISEKYQSYFMIGTLMAVIMLAVKNMANIEMFTMLFLILPLSIMNIERINN